MKFSIGDLIVSSLPYVHALYGQSRDTYCEECFEESPDVKRCSSCGIIPYCGVPCQKRNWKIHKYECKFLKACHPEVPDSTCRLYFKLLMKYSSNDPSQHSQGGRHFSDLQSNTNHIQNNALAMMKFSALSHIIRQYASNIIDIPEEQILLEIFGKMQTNCFEVSNERLLGIGTGLYLDASIFDHSCNPNAIQIFKGKRIEIKAIDNIKSLKDVRISYCDVLQSLQQRQEELNARYYFNCLCKRCTEGDEMFLRCQSSSCDGVVPAQTSICQVCKSLRCVTRSKVDNFRNLLSEELKNLDDQQSSAVIDSCKTILNHKDNVLHSFDIYNAQIIDRLYAALCEEGRYDQVVSVVEKYKLDNIYSKYYGSIHSKMFFLCVDIGHCFRGISDYKSAKLSYTNAWKLHEVIGCGRRKTISELKDWILECQNG